MLLKKTLSYVKKSNTWKKAVSAPGRKIHKSKITVHFFDIQIPPFPISFN